MTQTSYIPERLRARAAALRQLAGDLDAEAHAIESGAGGHAPPLDLAELGTEFGFTRESLGSAVRQGLRVHRGPRNRVMAFRSDVETWIRSRAWTPSARRKPESEDAALARAEAELMVLHRSGNRRKQGKTAA